MTARQLTTDGGEEPIKPRRRPRARRAADPTPTPVPAVPGHQYKIRVPRKMLAPELPPLKPVKCSDCPNMLTKRASILAGIGPVCAAKRAAARRARRELARTGATIARYVEPEYDYRHRSRATHKPVERAFVAGRMHDITDLEPIGGVL